MKCLVTGGAGFIGSHIVDLLIENNHEVTILDNFSHGNNLPSKNVTVIRGDVVDDLNQLLAGKSFDYVFHLAAQISLRYSMENPTEDAETNLSGSINVISWCLSHNVKKIIFASSAAVYAPDNELLIKEDHLTGPISPYGLSKLTVEQYLALIKENKNLSYVALRFSNVYGPRQNPLGEAGVISIFLDKILKGEKLVINGDGNQTRDFVYVKDIAKALLKAMELEGVFNVSTGNETSINQLITTLEKISQKKAQIENVEGKKEIFRNSLDPSKLQKSGWKAEYNLERGLNETYEWILKDKKVQKEEIVQSNMPNSKKLKILELTNFSSDGCGVFSRVKQESILLAKEGYEVKIFSSDFVKGKDERLPLVDKVENVIINRFHATKLGGESFMNWNFQDAALEFKPDVIIAHSYRHNHTTKALEVAEKLKCKVFLVTHAPFARGTESRSFIADKIVKFYDSFIGPNSLKKFSKIITITSWEVPYLKELGVNEDKIEYIPNGIPNEFFTRENTSKSERKIFFLGRIAAIKDIETVIRALKETKDQKICLEVAGPVSEQDYKLKLDALVNELNLKDRITFTGPIFDLEKKIDKLDGYEFFILPSKSEGMPQSLVEAMARGKIVIASDIIANKELVREGENGLFFKQGDSKECAKVIDKVFSLSEKETRRIKNNAINYSGQFNYKNIIKKIENLIDN